MSDVEKMLRPGVQTTVLVVRTTATTRDHDFAQTVNMVWCEYVEETKANTKKRKKDKALWFCSTRSI